VLALTSVASLMVSLDTQVVATALPVIRLRLHASLAALEWTVNAYTLSFGVLPLALSLLTAAFPSERHRVAMDLLAERPDRPCHDPAGPGQRHSSPASALRWAPVRAWRSPAPSPACSCPDAVPLPLRLPPRPGIGRPRPLV